MAQRTAIVYADGMVVRSEHKSGSFEDREEPGRTVNYDFIEARLGTLDYEGLDVRFPSDGSIPVPGRDEMVRLQLEARPSGGNVKLTVLKVEPAPSPAKHA